MTHFFEKENYQETQHVHQTNKQTATVKQFHEQGLEYDLDVQIRNFLFNNIVKKHSLTS